MRSGKSIGAFSPDDPVLIESALEIASGEVTPIDDLRSTAECRKERVRVLKRRTIRQPQRAKEGK